MPVLNYLIKQGKVVPERDGRNFAWHPEHIDQALECLEEAEQYSPEAIVFQQLGLDAEQYHAALAEAWDKLRDEFGDAATAINPNPDYFVMTVYPPRALRAGYVEFTLLDDVRRQMEDQRPLLRGMKGIPMPAEEKRRRAKR